jgi:hypothetical protein
MHHLARECSFPNKSGRGFVTRTHIGPAKDILSSFYRLAKKLLTSTAISTRRFKAVPSTVALSATGFSDPSRRVALPVAKLARGNFAENYWRRAKGRNGWIGKAVSE